MQRKLTITVHKEVYAGLRKVIGPRRISRFIKDLVRPHVLKARLESAYERGKLGALALISRQSSLSCETKFLARLWKDAAAASAYGASRR